jgi:hypothetical protein
MVDDSLQLIMSHRPRPWVLGGRIERAGPLCSSPDPFWGLSCGVRSGHIRGKTRGDSTDGLVCRYEVTVSFAQSHWLPWYGAHVLRSVL